MSSARGCRAFWNRPAFGSDPSACGEPGPQRGHGAGQRVPSRAVADAVHLGEATGKTRRISGQYAIEDPVQRSTSGTFGGGGAWKANAIDCSPSHDP